MKDSGFAERVPRLFSAYRFLPNLKRLGPYNAILNRLHEMAAQAKHMLGESIQHEKPWSLSRGGNPTHVTFPLPRGFVRHFSSVFGVDVIAIIHRRHDRAVSDVIASKFIGNQPAWLPAVAFE